MDVVSPVVKTATELYQNKLSRPAYKAYLNSEPLQKSLFDDCMREAKAHIEMCGTKYAK